MRPWVQNELKLKNDLVTGYKDKNPNVTLEQSNRRCIERGIKVNSNGGRLRLSCTLDDI